MMFTLQRLFSLTSSVFHRFSGYKLIILIVRLFTPEVRLESRGGSLTTSFTPDKGQMPCISRQVSQVTGDLTEGDVRDCTRWNIFTKTY
jgi:hypothetical protein